MTERRAIVEDKQLKYKGTFSTSEMYEMIERWLADNGFSNREESEHMEKITQSHKTVEILYQPVKKLTAYAKCELRIFIEIENMKRTLVETEGRKITMTDGELSITFDGFLATDYEGRAEIEPHNFLWRTLIDKLLKKNPSSEDEAKISSYVNELYNHLRDYLKKVN